MMKLALEIPTCRLERWSRLVDIDFVLAHKVLEDPIYANFFFSRNLSRELIMDNSTHELGYPKSFSDLKEAAEQCRADTVVIPDIVNESMTEQQYFKNVESVTNFTTFMGSEFETAAVLCGLSTNQRTFFVSHAMSSLASVLCFSMHIRWRLSWWEELVRHPRFDSISRVHILGMISLLELEEWVRISNKFPHIRFSVDTSKPISLGLQGVLLKHVDVRVNLRGGPLKSKDIMNVTHVTEEQDKCVEENIAYLKELCRSRS